MKIRNILITSAVALGSAGTMLAGGILAYTNGNIDKLEMLNRAVEQDDLKSLQRARGDINLQVGTSHAGAIIGNQLYMWGQNVLGQLGTGDNNNRNIPTMISIPGGTITDFVLGDAHSGIIVNGQAYMWGNNNYGQLGLGHTSNVNRPTLISGYSGVSSLAAGFRHSGFIYGSKIFMWGWNEVYGQLGDGKKTNRSTPTIASERYIAGYSAISLVAGYRHSGAIIIYQGRKQLFMWGSNEYGEIGYSTPNYQHRADPYRVKDINDIGTDMHSLQAGYWISGIIVNGRVYMWGRNNDGQLGINKKSSWEWVQPTTLTGATSLKMSPATSSSIAISGGYIYSWGTNYSANLGTGNQAAYIYPVRVSSSNYTQIGMGATCGGALMSNGKIQMWGDNSQGQYGTGSWGSGTWSPSTITNIFENTTINLNSSNDPNNFRNDVVYNVVKNYSNIKSLIESSSNLMNLPTSYNVSNVQTTGSISGGSGRITTRVDAAFPVITDITINGFLPVKNTINMSVATKHVPTTDTTFQYDFFYDLVSDANADTSGRNSKLAKWIIANYINNTNTYTVDLPENARITKVDNFVIENPETGEISFNITVDKYYKPSGNNFIVSTTSDPAIRLNNKVHLIGLPKAISLQDCVDSKGIIQILETQIEPQTSADKFFAAITGTINGGSVVNRVLLGEYLNTRFIPADAIVTVNRDMSVIQDPNIVGEKVAFTITADKYYSNGVLINTPLSQYITFMILPKMSTISVKDNIEDITSVITTGDALVLLKAQNNVKIEASKYLNFEHFPLNTFFSLNNVIANDNEIGTIDLSLNADKYYDLSSLNYQNFNKTFNDIKITGFKPSYDISKYPLITTNEKIDVNYNKEQFYNHVVQDNVPNRSFLSKYLDFRAIPTDAILTISKMEYNKDSTIWLTVKSDRYYNNGGITIMQDYEATILIALPTLDIVLIISLAAGGLFLLFLITCIIISVKNRNRIQNKIEE